MDHAAQELGAGLWGVKHHVSWILGTHDENPQNQSFETIDFTAFFAFLLEKCLVMCYN